MEKSNSKFKTNRKDKQFKSLLLASFAFVFLISLMLGQIFTNRSDTSDSWVLTIYLLQGFLMVIIFVKIGFNMSSGFKNPIYKKDHHNLKILLLSLMILTTFSALMTSILWENGAPKYILNNGANSISFMMILGAFLMGGYIIYTKLSPSGVITNASKASTPAIIAIFGIMFGIFAGFMFQTAIYDSWFSDPWFNTESGGYNFYNDLGPFAGLLISLSILTIIFIIVTIFDRRHNANNKENKIDSIEKKKLEDEHKQKYLSENFNFINSNRVKKVHYNIFIKNWSISTSVIALSVLGIVSLSSSSVEIVSEGDVGWELTSQYGYWSAWIIDGIAGDGYVASLSINGNNIFEATNFSQSTYESTFWNHGGSMQLLGMLLGGIFYFSIINKWEFKLDFNLKKYASSILLGATLGFLIVMAGGSYISACISSIAVGDFSGYIYFVILFISIIFFKKITPSYKGE